MEVIKGLTNSDGSHPLPHVYQGEKNPVDFYPSCFVIALPIDIKPISFLLSQNYYRFDIVIVNTQSDTAKGYLDTFKLIGDIYDVLVGDRTLGGTTCNLEPEQVIPSWKSGNTGIEGFYLALRVRFERSRA